MDLSNDNYYNYGLPWKGQFSQTNKTNIKIIAVQGNYSQEGKSDEVKLNQEYMSHTSSGTKQEQGD